MMGLVPLPRRYSLSSILGWLISLLILAVIKIWKMTGGAMIDRIHDKDDQYWAHVYAIRVAKHVLANHDRYLIVGSRYVKITGKYVEGYKTGQTVDDDELAEICIVRPDGIVAFRSFLKPSLLDEPTVKVRSNAEELGIPEAELRKAPEAYWLRDHSDVIRSLFDGKRLIISGDHSEWVLRRVCGGYSEEDQKRLVPSATTELKYIEGVGEVYKWWWFTNDEGATAYDRALRLLRQL